MTTKSDDVKQTATKKQSAEDSTEASRQAAIDKRIEEKIDRDLRDSFPASDPPGWTSGLENAVRKRTRLKSLRAEIF